MAEINCNACETIRETDPSFILNGFTSTECASLKNNTGLVAGGGHNDETDLNNLNDCLIGNLAAELVKYDICDWKDFMDKYLPNEWTMNKALICAVAGLWQRVQALEAQINS